MLQGALGSVDPARIYAGFVYFLAYFPVSPVGPMTRCGTSGAMVFHARSIRGLANCASNPGLFGCASIKGTRREKSSLTTASLGRLVPDHFKEVHSSHETVAIRGGPSATPPTTTSERGGLLQSAHRRCFHYDSPANDFDVVVETNVVPADDCLVAPAEFKSLSQATRRRNIKPARIASLQSGGQEPDAFLAALSLGALFVLILTSVVMKLFIG
jgi:hypothetical protein